MIVRRKKELSCANIRGPYLVWAKKITLPGIYGKTNQFLNGLQGSRTKFYCFNIHGFMSLLHFRITTHLITETCGEVISSL